MLYNTLSSFEDGLSLNQINHMGMFTTFVNARCSFNAQSTDRIEQNTKSSCNRANLLHARYRQSILQYRQEFMQMEIAYDKCSVKTSILLYYLLWESLISLSYTTYSLYISRLQFGPNTKSWCTLTGYFVNPWFNLLPFKSWFDSENTDFIPFLCCFAGCCQTISQDICIQTACKTIVKINCD